MGRRAVVVACAMFVLGGCERAHTWGEPIRYDVAQAALERWQDAGNGSTEACEEESANGQVTVFEAEADEILSICSNSVQPGTRRMGCNMWGHDSDGTKRTSIILNAGLTESEREDTLEHELRHWLARCSGMHKDGDWYHEDSRVWFAYNGHNIL